MFVPYGRVALVQLANNRLVRKFRLNLTLRDLLVAGHIVQQQDFAYQDHR